ncbi:hypothetical protein GCM10027093_23110 [Paraburkholderia jirisanensis]
MARPKIGIFGALFAVGSVLAWRWVQKQRAAQAVPARDLTRWEGEGGAVTNDQPLHPKALAGTTHPRSANGADHSASGDAWPFPRS